MTAEERFKELGYRRVENEHLIVYTKKTNLVHHQIIFDKYNEELEVRTTSLYLHEIDALCQQLKELGWCEE